MSEPVTGPIPAAGGRHSASAGAGAQAPAEERGRTTIADTVVERVAARLAGEVDQVRGSARRVLGVPTGREDAAKAPRVDADVRGTSCSLRVRLSVTYPAPVARVTEEVRQHLVDGLAALLGLEVHRVAVDVTALHPPGTPTKRSVQ